MPRPRLHAALAALLLSAPAAPAPPREGWWHPSWTARIPFTVEVTAGESVRAHVPTAGLCRPDGADLRVLSAAGEPVPHTLLAVGPGDQARLYFDVRPFREGKRRGWIYLGNPAARAPKRRWEGRHGLVLDVRHLPRGKYDTPEQLLALLKRADRPIGRGFAARIFQGLNPFGPQPACLAVFKGYYRASRSGLHHFGINSVDASLLAMEGRVLVAWTGDHGPQRGSIRKRTAAVELEKGWHPFYFLNASRRHGVRCSLGVKPPGARRLTLAPPSRFMPWSRMEPLALEKRRQGRQPWFTWRRLSDLGLSDREVVLAAFTDRSGIPPEERRATWWDFGDGTVAKEAEPRHLFLEAGTFTVTCTILLAGGGKAKAVQQVHLRPRGVHGRQIFKEVGRYVEVMRDYNPARLSPRALGNALFVFRAAKAFDRAIPFLEELIRRSPDLDRGGLAREAFFLVDELRFRRRDYRKALAILQGIRSQSRTARTILRADLLRAHLLYENLDEAAPAREIMDRLLRRPDLRRLQDLHRFALVKQADLLLEAGRREEAVALLREAAATKTKRAFGGLQEASAGEHLLAYQQYAARKEYAQALRELAAWELDAPLDKVEGPLRFFRADLYLLLGMPRRALVEVERLRRANPTSPDLPAALIMAAHCHLALGRRKEARRVLTGIIEDHPVSEARREAEKLLRRNPAEKR